MIAAASVDDIDVYFQGYDPVGLPKSSVAGSRRVGEIARGPLADPAYASRPCF